MKPYEHLDDTLKAKLQMICDEDPYGLRPQTLYSNISYSVGDPQTLANLFAYHYPWYLPSRRLMMKIIKEVKNSTTFTRFVEHNNLTFRLIYDNRNGVPLGFDSRFQAQIKTSENLWHTIAGKTDVGFTPISYVCSQEQRERDSHTFFKLLQEHIELIY